MMPDLFCILQPQIVAQAVPLKPDRNGHEVK